jgi:hypothetical protein
VGLIVAGLPNNLFVIANIAGGGGAYSAQWQDSPDGNTFTNRTTSGAPIAVAALWPYSVISGGKIYLPGYVSHDANWYDSPWTTVALTSSNFPNLAASLSSTGYGSIATIFAPAQLWKLGSQWVAVGFLDITLTSLGISHGVNPLRHYVIICSDGASWTDTDPSMAFAAMMISSDVEFRWDSANSRFLIFTLNGSGLQTSTDLVTLTAVAAYSTAVGSGVTNYTRTTTGIAMDGAGTIVAVGYGWYTPDGHTITDRAPWIVRSTNWGTSWSSVTYSGPNPPTQLTGVLWDGGQFVAKGIGLLGTSPDGSTWTWINTGDTYDYNWATNSQNVTLYQEWDESTFSFGAIKRLVGSTPILDETGANVLDESSSNISSN